MFTVTSQSLLAGLADPENQTAWRQYVERYRPVLIGYVRRVGVLAADVEDVTQQILLAFSEGYRHGKYDRDRGRLRSWLFGIANGTIRTYWKTRGREVQAGNTSGTDFFARVEDPAELDELWDEQWRDAVLVACLREVEAEVEPKTFEAFDLFACQGLPAKVVGERLGMTENAVFLAKQRVLKRLREVGPAVEEVF